VFAARDHAGGGGCKHASLVGLGLNGWPRERWAPASLPRERWARCLLPGWQTVVCSAMPAPDRTCAGIQRRNTAPPLFRDLARKPWTIHGGMLEPAPEPMVSTPAVPARPHRCLQQRCSDAQNRDARPRDAVPVRTSLLLQTAHNRRATRALWRRFWRCTLNVRTRQVTGPQAAAKRTGPQVTLRTSALQLVSTSATQLFSDSVG
jgi:hypothetical protein